MNPFYNPTQHRVRAVWRILLQVALFFIGVTLLSLLLGIVLINVLSLAGQIPAYLAQDRAALQVYITKTLGATEGFHAMYSMVNLVSMLFSVFIMGRFIDKRPFRDFGFHFSPAWWRDLGFGLAVGALLMVFIFGVEYAAGWVTITGTLVSKSGSFATDILFALIAFIGVGIYEELLSRGYELRNLAEGLNWKSIGSRTAVWLGYLASSAVFGFLYLGNPNASWTSTFNLVLVGLFLGAGFILTGELAISIGLHITWNFFQGNVFGFPVSGGRSNVSFVGIRQLGPTLWTGGDFGPEAGLIGLLAMAIGIVLIVLYVRATRKLVRIEDRLAVYGEQAEQPAEEAVSEG